MSSQPKKGRSAKARTKPEVLEKMIKCARHHDVSLDNNHVPVQEGRKAVILLSYGEITSPNCILDERPANSVIRRKGETYTQHSYTGIPLGYKVMFETANVAWIGETAMVKNQLRYRFGNLDENGMMSICSEWMANPTAAIKSAYTKVTGNKDTDSLNGKLLLGAHYENMQILLREHFRNVQLATTELEHAVNNWLATTEVLTHQPKIRKRIGMGSSSSSEGSSSPKRMRSYDESTITASSEDSDQRAFSPEDSLPEGLDFDAMCSNVDIQDPQTYRQNSLSIDDPFMEDFVIQQFSFEDADFGPFDWDFRSVLSSDSLVKQPSQLLAGQILQFSKFQTSSAEVVRDFVQRAVDLHQKETGKNFAIDLRAIRRIVQVAKRLEGPIRSEEGEDECYMANFLPALRIVEALVFEILARDENLKLHHSTLRQMFDDSPYKKSCDALSKEVRAECEKMIEFRMEELRSSGIGPSSVFPSKKGPVPQPAALRHETKFGILAFTSAVTKLPISSYLEECRKGME